VIIYGEFVVSLFIRTVRRESRGFNKIFISIRNVDIVSEIVCVGCSEDMLAYVEPTLVLLPWWRVRASCLWVSGIFVFFLFDSTNFLRIGHPLYEAVWSLEHKAHLAGSDRSLIQFAVRWFSPHLTHLRERQQ
jgi:hypothetical protein